jgi:aryl-alcohol dehydrogenase-like predicted oxidoreductase
VSEINPYYCHRMDGKTPIEEIVQAMTELKKEGKIGSIGISDVPAITLR